MPREAGDDPWTISPGDADWPVTLTERLSADAPTALVGRGPRELLGSRRIALFCSAQTPGDVILCTHDAARRWRDEGQVVISGFHSPIEKDCLRNLLRGKQPIILCPARAIETMRIPTDCRAAFDNGRLLILSPFVEEPKRITQDSARRRNEIVAALADEAYLAHLTPGGHTERIAERLKEWSVPDAG